jgi:hypothetical protein
VTFRKSDDEAQDATYFALSDGAYRLDDSARQYCVRKQSDGRLPARVLHTLTPTRDRRSRARYVDELEKAGLWLPIRTEGFRGWEIPAVLRWNWTKEQAEAFRASQAANGRKGGQALWRGRRGNLALVLPDEDGSQ